MKRFITILTAALLLIAAIGCTRTYANSTGSAENTGKTEETAVQATEAPATEAPATQAPATEAPAAATVG